jgi:hypothetical protein
VQHARPVCGRETHASSLPLTASLELTVLSSLSLQTAAIPPAYADLPLAGQFLLWAARQWICRLDPAHPCSSVLAQAFARAGVPEALRDLDIVLGTLAVHARRRLDFRPPSDGGLGDDERLYLHALAALQARTPAHARDVCAEWLPPSEAALAVDCLSRIADRFLVAGLDLSRLRASAAGLAPSRASASQPAATVH